MPRDSVRVLNNIFINHKRSVWENGEARQEHYVRSYVSERP